MNWFLGCMSGFMGFLCRIFGVTPDKIREEKEKNPSPTRKD
ncbi:MAG: hypothetical protein ACT4N4_02190 [Rhodospirillales bacterium]